MSQKLPELNNDNYTGDEICIVGVGSVLPDADNVQQFWNNLKEGKVSIKDLTDEVFDKSIYYDETGEIDNKTYSYKGAVVKSKNLPIEYKNKLHQMAVDATRQAFDCLNNKNFENKKIDIYLGCMENSQFLSNEKFYLKNKDVIEKFVNENEKIKDKKSILNEIKKYLNNTTHSESDLVDSVFVSSVLSSLKKEFNINGKTSLVDSACASSLSAIDIAVNVLKNNEADMVLTGGAEAGMTPEAFVTFCRAGALSRGVCIPFDKNSDGISLGEGSVIFVLQKLSNAIKDKNHIYGIIKNIGSSSDGNASSFFSPSKSGQLLALNRAYKNININNIDYVECHGTGTNVGDKTEISSLAEFFKNKNNKVPVGSVKSQVGHIRGCAGSVSVLKCLMILKNGIIPASKYINKSIINDKENIFINKDDIHIKNDNRLIGVSSFGFGNINYHIILEKYNDKKVIKYSIKSLDLQNKNIVLVAKGFAKKEDIKLDYVSKQFKILPNRIDQIDDIQILTLMSFHNAIQKNNLFIKDKDNVKVVSASSTGLSLLDGFSHKVRCNEFSKMKSLSEKDVKGLTVAIGKKDNVNEIKEDMSFGTLNNVIADRISNFYNFRGKNFNVDSNFNSPAIAIDIAIRELQLEDGVVIIVYPEEKLANNNSKILRDSVHCLIFSTLEYAKANDLPILREFVTVTYEK